MILAGNFVNNQVVTNRRIAVLLLCVFSFLVTNCTSQGDRQETVIQGLTMGTSFSVKVINGKAKEKRLEQGIKELLNKINGSMSTYLADSELSKINQNINSAWIPVSAELMAVLQLADEVSRTSSGAFDTTIGPLVNLWGFGPTKNQLKEPSAASISALMAHIGYNNLILDIGSSRVKKLEPALYIDLSGIAKGYAVDEVAEFLSKQGVTNYLVEIGGEIRVKGRNKDNVLWRLAIEQPVIDERSVQQVIELTNEAIATSGDYRNYFETDTGKRFSHTIDPVTGYPITNRVASVSVITSSAAYSDAMATALMVLGAKDGVALADRLKLKAIFLVKRDKGFEEVVSSAFGSVKR